MADILATAPFDSTRAAEVQAKFAERHHILVEFTNSLGMRFRLLPPGEFVMGSPETEKLRSADETAHRVRITRPYYLAVCEITQAEYEKIMGENPAYWSPVGYKMKRGKEMDTSRFPVERVAWFQAVEFCKKLSAQTEEQKEGRVYRLPTEAEWEYACRAGTETPFPWGTQCNGEQANMLGTQPYGTDKKGPYLNRVTNVGSYPSNAFGICDMIGNVWEWCSDYYAEDYFNKSPVENPTGPAEGKERVMRGGAWRYHVTWCRSATRHGYDPRIRAYDLGFRVALDLRP